MAEYCVISDMTVWIDEADMVKLVSKEPEAKVSDVAVTATLNAVIKSAGAEIDSYLIGRYGSGLRTGTTPPSLLSKCSKLAVYFLYLRRRAVDDDWQTNYEEVIAWLTDLRDGKGDLLESPDTGEVIEEATDSIQHDAEVLTSTGSFPLTANDRRNYTPEKQGKLFGLGPKDHSR